MKCRSCGGELRFQNGVWICQNCGASFASASIYENVEVCICYLETDGIGRRTKDSFFAQEVYKKLEASKINAFYERISADGIAGEELEAIRYTAIQKAKAIIVVGASIDSFNAIAEKYGSYLEGKTIIPFCIDVNPGAIPRFFGKVQAVDYSTIGWEKDLINGIYSLFGRQNEINTNSLYASTRRKIGIFSVAAIVVLLAVLAGVFFFFREWFGEDEGASNQPTDAGTTQTTEKPLSQQEIFEQATSLVEDGDFCKALELLYQIPEYPFSASVIEQVYAKYEGYYQIGNVAIHLEIRDNKYADVEVKIISEEKTTQAAISAEISVDRVVYNYVDNYRNTGKIDLRLENTGLRLILSADTETTDTEALFLLSEKSDQSLLQFDKKTLLSWLEKNYTLSKLKEMGYQVSTPWSLDNAGCCSISEIQNTDITIYLTVFGDWDPETGESEYRLAGIAAPAEFIAPELIGKKALPCYTEEVLYWPNACYTWLYWDCRFTNFDILFSEDDVYTKGETISNDTLIGVVMKENLISFYDDEWDAVLVHAMDTTVVPRYFMIPTGTNLYRQPSYDSEIKSVLSKRKEYFQESLLTTDQNGNTWYEITWQGWICLSDFWEVSD